MSEQIVFEAQVVKVATTADKGIRITLDLPEYAVLAASELMAIYQADVALRVTVERLPKDAGK